MRDRILLLLLPLLLLLAPACSLLLSFPGDEGRPCVSGECKAGYRCEQNVCRAVEQVPGNGQGFTFTGHIGTLSSTAPGSSGPYQVIHGGFTLVEAMCNGSLCVIGGLRP